MEKLWKRINKKGEDECWEWLGSVSKNGYGQFGINNKVYYTHRAVYELIYGIIPKGLCVCHKCNNPPCCNPNHLFLGTARENSDKRDREGRWRTGDYCGEKHGRSKLTEKNIMEIRTLYSTGKYFQRELGEMFGVSRTHIDRILGKRTWKHLNEENK